MVKSILTKRQKLLLDECFSNSSIKNHFYLSGGTALAEYYLHHRLSEDLDFFSEIDVDIASIHTFFRSISKKVGIQKMDIQQSFNRNLLYLHFSDEIIKTEFTYYPFTQIEKPKEIRGVRVDSLVDIAVNKTFTIYQKPRSRDFIDLYLILKKKGWNFLDIRRKARIKFDTHIDPLQLAQKLLEVRTIKDYPNMIMSLEEVIWQNFWMKEADALKKEVLD